MTVRVHSGTPLRRVLGVELLALDALGEPLQRDRPVADVRA